jgi:hypothetical protein
MISIEARPAPRPASPWGRLRRTLFGIAPGEASPTTRGFRVDRPELAQRLERVGVTFLTGYHAALEDTSPDRVLAEIERQVAVGWRGFAYEGAGMALAILDTVLPTFGRSRLEALLAGPGQAHRYLIHVGAGWSLARLPRRIGAARRRIDPLLGWLMLDGYGFHQGFFHHPKAVGRGERPRRLLGYERRAFDQGLGRSLWFVDGADADRLIATVGSFDPVRHGDLWAGIGLAAAYAGGMCQEDLEWLRRAAGEHAADLAQGAAFAAKARLAGDDPTPHTDPVCRVLCRMPARDAATVTDRVADWVDPASDSPSPHQEPSFEIWRRGIRDHFLPGARP